MTMHNPLREAVVEQLRACGAFQTPEVIDTLTAALESRAQLSVLNDVLEWAGVPGDQVRASARDLLLAAAAEEAVPQ